MNARQAGRVSLAALLPLVLLVACGDVDPPPAAPPAPTVGPPSLTAVPSRGAEKASDVAPAIAGLAVIHYVQGRAFHDLAVTVAEAVAVDPRWFAVASDTETAVQGVPWPDAVAPAAEALIDELRSLADAAAAEDLEAARAAAEAIHDTEHDLREAASGWISTVSPTDPADFDAAVVSVLTAIDVIDQSAFHALAEDVAKATEVSPRWQEVAEGALSALHLAGWPVDAAAQEEAMETALREFADAVAAGDLSAAALAAESLHDTQHELSEAAYAWLAENHRAMSHVDPMLAFACMLRAADAAGRIDFHDMAAELAVATELDPRIESSLTNLLVVLDFEADEEKMRPFVDKVGELLDAVADGDLEAAREAAEGAHDVEHDFSEALFEGMGVEHHD